MKNLKVSAKLIISFGLVIVLTIACVVVSVFGVRNVQSNMDFLVDTEVNSLLRAKDVQIQVEAVSRSVLAAALENDETLEANYLKEATEAADSMMEKLDLITYAGTETKTSVL